ncbi:MAG: right-handed parallel beta-helix repeat-containing protein [Candidatus Aenigmatarchaeota archaeon]
MNSKKLWFTLILTLAFFINVFSLEVKVHTPPFSITYPQAVQANLPNQLFNFTVNNTLSLNITQLNITLPSGFSFISNSNGTNAFSDFFVYGNTLVWQNFSGLILANETKNFWFNSSVPDVGYYNFTLKALYENGSIEELNVTVIVRKIFVTINLNSTIVNPGDAINVYGKAILLPDNLTVPNINISIYLDDNFLSNVTTDSNGNYSYTFSVPSDLGIYNITINTTDSNGISGLNSSLIYVLLINKPGYYTLSKDILNLNLTTGINITSENVTLDCNGKIIEGNFALNDISSKNLYGIYVNSENVTIKNCIIRKWQTGIFLDSQANFSIIENNIINYIFGSFNGGNAIGILVKSSYNLLRNNTISNLTGGAGGSGGYQGSGGSGGISAGIYLQNSQNNTIYSNTISNLTGGAGGSGGDFGSGGSGGISAGI